MAKRCPKCRLFNPDVAERCDCGFDFHTGRIATSYARPEDERIKAEQGMTVTQVGLWNIAIGASVTFLAIVGAVILAGVTHELMGDVRLIWYGGPLVGAVILFRGIGQYYRAKKLGARVENAQLR